MTIIVSCPRPECGKRYRVEEERIGQIVVCRRCGQRFPAIADQATIDNAQSPGQTSAAAPSDSAAPPEPVPGQFGRFEVRKKIGGGAFGAVYLAYDPVLDREVALKVPRAAVLNSAEARARFLREPKAAAQLRHPHIVPVYDAGSDGDHLYIASAYIEGKTLADAMAQSPLDPAEAARIVFDLAEALHYAHETGVVHRDVKPANIMIDRQGQALLMDFGLARIERAEEELTHDHTVMGTPAYMAPEQADKAFGSVGPASDQYSLGVVLYELLCARRPFDGPPAVVIFNALHTVPDPPRAHQPSVPRDLETICLKAMARRSEDRYSNCQELAQDLRRWLHDEPIRARKMGPLERAAKWAKRNPVLAGLSALVVALAVVSTISAAGLLASRQQLAASLQSEQQQRELAQTETARAEEQTRTAEEKSRIAEIQTKLARQREGEAQQQERVAKQALADLQREVDARNKAEAAEKAERRQRLQIAEELKVRDTEVARSTAEADEARRTAEAAAKETEQALQERRKTAEEVPWFRYIHALSDAERLLERNQPAALAQLDACPKELRTWEWDFLRSLAQGGKPVEATVTRFPPPPRGLFLSTCISRCLLDDDGVLCLVRFWTRPSRSVIYQLAPAPRPVCVLPVGVPDDEESVTDILISPGGRYLLFVRLRTWQVFDTAQERLLGQIKGVPAGAGWLVQREAGVAPPWDSPFSRDGEMVLLQLGTTLSVAALANPAVTLDVGRLKSQTTGTSAVGFTPDGLIAALVPGATSGTAKLATWRADFKSRQVTAAAEKTLEVGGERLPWDCRLVFSEDGSRMVADSLVFQLVLPFERSFWRIPESHSFAGFSPDGKRVALRKRPSQPVYGQPAAPAAFGTVVLCDAASGRELPPLRFLTAWQGHELNRDWTMAVRLVDKLMSGAVSRVQGTGGELLGQSLHLWVMPSLASPAPAGKTRRR